MGFAIVASCVGAGGAVAAGIAGNFSPQVACLAAAFNVGLALVNLGFLIRGED